MIIGGLRIKDRISLYEMRKIFSFYKEAVQYEYEAFAIRKISRFKFLKKISKSKECLISVLSFTTEDKVKRKHLKHFYDIMKHLDMVNDKKKDVDQDDLDDSLAWIAAQINKTHFEVLSGFTAHEASLIVEQITKREIARSIAMIRAQHSPKEYLKEISEIIRGIKHKHDPAVEEIQTFDMLRKACFQPS